MVERLEHERGIGFRQLVNDALRDALPRMSEPPRRRRRFQTDAVALGRCLVPSLDDVTAALALAEGERFR